MPAGFFSGPFEPAEMARLLALVEERRALRGGVESESVPVALVELGGFVATTPDDAPADVGVPTAFFDVRRGGVVARAVKRLANVPLRVFGRPQRHFDRAVVELLESAAAMLRALRDDEARMRDAIERMDERLASLERGLDASRTHAADPPGPRPT
jgi:hypothetical protein